MKSAESIQSHIRQELTLAIDGKAAKAGEQQWRTGIPGAILEGRISVLQELLDWIERE
jgi:hypothetical protein